MTGTYSSTILRIWKTNSFSMMVASSFTSGPAENELLNDLAEMEDKLIFSDDCKFFTSDPVERFGLFAQSGLDWKFARSKHRELHSMWCLFSSAHLFWFLHILVFALSMSWVARDDLPSCVICFCFSMAYSFWSCHEER